MLDQFTESRYGEKCREPQLLHQQGRHEVGHHRRKQHTTSLTDAPPPQPL
jgi:hypothetical protein